MKKTFASIRTLAALLIASAALAACSNDDGAIIGEQPAQQGPQVYTLTLQAGKADNAQTRALALDGTKLVAKWVAGEQVTVTKGTTSLGTLSVKEGSVSDDGQTCTFTGTLTGKIATDDVLTLTYHPVASSDYSSQTGTLVSAAACDMATASVTVTAVDNGKNTITAGTAVFETQTAVLKINLQDTGGSALSASSLTISAGGAEIFTLSSLAVAGTLYFALPSAATVAAPRGMTTEELAALPITFSAKVGDDTYTATKTGYPFAAGKYYETTLKMAKALTYPIALSAVTSDYIGSVVTTDGNVYATASDATTAGKTAVAMIAYVGEAGSADASSATYKGLALALADVSESKAWCSQYSETCLTTQYSSEDAAKADMAGIANTDALCSHASHTHAAVKAARDYSVTRPAGTSAWFLPSAGQWDKMTTAADGYGNLKTNAGLQSKDYYWSSSERLAGDAWMFDSDDGRWDDNRKDDVNLVRACLAF